MKSEFVCGSVLKVYCRKNGFFFLYKYLKQYSSGYWSLNKYSILSRISPLKKGQYKGAYDSYYLSITPEEIRRLDNTIKSQSFRSFNEPRSETSTSHRVYGEAGRQSTKVFACSDWTREYIKKNDPIDLMRQKYTRTELHEMIMRTEMTI